MIIMLKLKYAEIGGRGGAGRGRGGEREHYMSGSTMSYLHEQVSTYRGKYLMYIFPEG